MQRRGGPSTSFEWRYALGALGFAVIPALVFALIAHSASTAAGESFRARLGALSSPSAWVDF